MKTHNNNPIWHNQPLRLNDAQTHNPNLVLNNLFECYRLQEIRETLWQWMVEAVSSPRSTGNDHHERNNYVFFYEKIEALVEAAWIMNRNTDAIAIAVNPTLSEPDHTTEKTSQPTRYSKPSRLIEKVTTHPDEVIAEVFSLTPFDELQEQLLPTWLRVTLINTSSPYTAAIDRERLYEFYEQLLRFLEALYISFETGQDHQSSLFNEAQSSNHSTIITSFFQQFSMDYIRRELSDFVEAGIGYEGHYPNDFTPWLAWMTYNHVLCLTEAAYQLYINRQMQAITKVLVPCPRPRQSRTTNTNH